MTTKHSLLICALALTAGLSSCKKDEEEEPVVPAPTTAQPSNPTPTPADAAGVLVAVQTSNYITAPFVGEIYQPIGLGIAVFGDFVTPAYIDGGTVSLNGSAFTKQSNNSYVFQPTATSATGIDLADHVTWSVSGNAANTIPAINQDAPNVMPTGPKYTGSTEIGRTADFTVSSAITIENADSTYYGISSGSVVIKKTAAGGASVTFTAAEMGTLPTGSGYVQIAPYNIASQTIAGKKIYFVNESVVTKSVTIQ